MAELVEPIPAGDPKDRRHTKAPERISEYMERLESAEHLRVERDAFQRWKKLKNIAIDAMTEIMGANDSNSRRILDRTEKQQYDAWMAILQEAPISDPPVTQEEVHARYLDKIHRAVWAMALESAEKQKKSKSPEVSLEPEEPDENDPRGFAVPPPGEVRQAIAPKGGKPGGAAVRALTETFSARVFTEPPFLKERLAASTRIIEEGEEEEEEAGIVKNAKTKKATGGRRRSKVPKDNHKVAPVDAEITAASRTRSCGSKRQTIQAESSQEDNPTLSSDEPLPETEETDVRVDESKDEEMPLSHLASESGNEADQRQKASTKKPTKKKHTASKVETPITGFGATMTLEEIEWAIKWKKAWDKKDTKTQEAEKNDWKLQATRDNPTRPPDGCFYYLVASTAFNAKFRKDGKPMPNTWFKNSLDRGKMWEILKACKAKSEGGSVTKKVKVVAKAPTKEPSRRKRGREEEHELMVKDTRTESASDTSKPRCKRTRLKTQQSSTGSQPLATTTAAPQIKRKTVTLRGRATTRPSRQNLKRKISRARAAKNPSPVPGADLDHDEVMLEAPNTAFSPEFARSSAAPAPRFSSIVSKSTGTNGSNSISAEQKKSKIVVVKFKFGSLGEFATDGAFDAEKPKKKPRLTVHPPKAVDKEGDEEEMKD